MLLLIGYIILGIVSAVYIFGVIYRRNSGVCTCTNKLNGKTVIITGATAGIGKETALDLASRGARVILACRDIEKANQTKEWIISQTGNKNIVCRHLELSDLDSVRKFSEETLKTEAKLDILINNAGVVVANKELSKQGYELTLATNHYGSFLLTNLLLDLLIKSGPSRIINVSSVAHKWYDIDLKDLHFDKRKYKGSHAYSQSKLCNILFTNELVHRLADKGVTTVTVNSLHPGGVATDILKKQNKALTILMTLTSPGFKDAKLGAQTTIHLAVSREAAKISGEYFVDCKIADTSKQARDPELARKIWELSEKQVKLTSEEKHI